jgi:ABC-type oligopeptide transport system ATPase subunit
MDNNTILSVRNLKQHFKSGRGKNKLVVKAVDGVSFDIQKGEVFGLVGESGCGKTTTGRTIIKLHNPTDGEVFFYGERIGAGLDSVNTQLKEAKKSGATPEEINEIKEEIKQRKKDNFNVDTELMKKMQMIFQDPIASLNPRMTVKEIIAEGLRIAGIKDADMIQEKVEEVLEIVGLVPEHAGRYPHEFSGGQRQRIGIARALVVNPEFIIADEPISALDVSIQAQVINLLNDLRERLGLTIMFIAHDLSVVKYFCDRIAVMYYGNLVELASSEELFKNPLHPYTRSLLSAVPIPDPDIEKSRTRIRYDQSVHDYSEQLPNLVEITPNHWILANDAEIEQYKTELK